MEYLNRISPWYFLIVAFLTTLALVWFGAEGVRGTDQYWYVADVERIVNGERPITNTFFPGEMLRQNTLPENNYIFHNSPMLYIVAMISSVLSIYHAWLVTNLICHFLVAVSLFSIARKFTDLSIATVVTGIYLISPIAIWQTINPLLEMYYSALLSLILLCFFYRQTLFFQYALWLLLALGVVSHPIFVVPAFLWGVFTLFENRLVRKSAIVEAGVFLLILFFALKYGKVWFPSSFLPDLKAIIASVVPEKSNMFWYYTEVLPTIDREFLWVKFLAAFEKHFFVLKFAPMYIFTNVAILSSMYLCFSNLKKWWKILLPTYLFVGQYLCMLVLQQNHPRFQQIVAAASFLLIACALHSLHQRFKGRGGLRGIAVATLIAFSFCSFYIVSVARGESKLERNDLSSLERQLEVIPEDARIVAIDVRPHNPFSYIVRPRDTLFIRTDMLDEVQIERAIDLFQPNYFIVRGSEREVDGELITGLESGMFRDLLLYQVGR